MNYTLNTNKQKVSVFDALRTLYPLVSHERKNLFIATIAIVISSGLNLLVPFLIGVAVDDYIIPKQFNGLLGIGGILLAAFIGAFFASYIQTKVMGSIAQRMLYTLRNTIFNKLQTLPVAFFNQNKIGDLISRINNDTDKLNQFFSQSLMQLVGSIFIMLGAAIFVISINWRLGLVTLAPAFVLVIITRFVSPWIKQENKRSLKEAGSLSAEIQESLSNFKVTAAFNRRDYFRNNFTTANDRNFTTAIGAGLANSIFTPLYGLFAHGAQLAVLLYGIHLILTGMITIGILVSFLAYVLRFYDPLRQLAAMWTSLQVALAGWDRINDILILSSDMPVLKNDKTLSDANLLIFKNVSFSYEDDVSVLDNISFSLEQGKTYALVGPTGGGKTTTASLMSRLFDPTTGTIYFEGRDIRSYEAGERSDTIGVLLQEPFLFSGTVGENIIYGNDEMLPNTSLETVLRNEGLLTLIDSFDRGLETIVDTGAEQMSLGQRQVIAFIRAVLRKPKLLILDEATANIDTVTEQLLEAILTKLPKETTLVIIAHRLNTIERADEIFFVNGGSVTQAGSMEHAVEMLTSQTRNS